MKCRHLVAAALAAALLLLVAVPSRADEAPPCDTQSVVTDDMWAGGWVLDGHLAAPADIDAFIEMIGPMPAAFTAADFKAVQLWGAGGEGRAIMFMAGDGCARFIVDGPRLRYQALAAGLRDGGALSE
jgi:hypothetical protein